MYFLLLLLLFVLEDHACSGRPFGVIDAAALLLTSRSKLSKFPYIHTRQKIIPFHFTIRA